MLSNLDPDSEYEVDVYLIPVPDSKIELISNTTLTFKTLPPVQGMDGVNIFFCLRAQSFTS